MDYEIKVGDKVLFPYQWFMDESPIIEGRVIAICAPLYEDECNFGYNKVIVEWARKRWWRTSRYRKMVEIRHVTVIGNDEIDQLERMLKEKP